MQPRELNSFEIEAVSGGTGKCAPPPSSSPSHKLVLASGGNGGNGGISALNGNAVNVGLLSFKSSAQGGNGNGANGGRGGDAVAVG